MISKNFHRIHHATEFKTILVFFIAFLATSCTISTPKGLYSQATDAIAQGKHEQAISGLTKAIESDPKFAEAYVNRGIAYSEIGNVEAAIADYTKAIEIKPDLIDAHYNLGNAHMQLEEYSQAIAAYDKVIVLDPNYAIALGNRGNAHHLIGNTSQAIQDIETAAEIFKQKGNEQAKAIAKQQLQKIK